MMTRPGGRWVVGAALAALLAVPAAIQGLGLPAYYLVFLYFFFFWVAQATSWNVISGYAGYFSFGQGAFYGAGVYGAAVLIDRHGAPYGLAIPAGAVASALVACGIGLVVFRLRQIRGPVFALVTLAAAVALHSLVNNVGYLDGGRGIPLPKLEYPWGLSDVEFLYFAGLLVACVAVGVGWWTHRSRHGWGLRAIHDDERVAEGLGVPTFAYKIAALALSGAVAGLSGGLHALQVRYVTADAVFSLRVPLLVIMMCVLGGRRHWLGPILGAGVVHAINDRLSGPGLGTVSEVVMGLLLMVVVATLPDGIYSRVTERGTTATVVGLVAMGVAAAAGASLLDALAIGVGTFVLLLVTPKRLWGGGRGIGRRPRGVEAARG
ncbi:MAG: branched-chain amino acid ABC transporter permease [Armatimonadota bacterium]|nr:branched-chain amino acid ABC transporter permease [Armatimonadota bacterium]MDR7533859.1 branched-chain amino acid ABC transporter permease [Armatimonadota bacterium]MDR7535107.1 branched-chain amino acid ABC transporter permease [Armatimonadota bacterium]